MTNLLNYTYWTNLLPEPFTHGTSNALLILFGAMIVAAMVLWILAVKKNRNMYLAKGGRKLARLFAWTAVIGLLLMWIRGQQVSFFSGRFWFLFLIIGFVFFLVFVLKYIFITIPKQSAEFAEKARIEKYLPKKK